MSANDDPLAGAELRVGQGFDVHPWSDDPERPLVLGGVVLRSGHGLLGHSDADVIAHALTDAILGATGEGDIGSLFPDTDRAYAGADSLALLRLARARIADRGWTVMNADCTVILDQPKIAPRRDEMQTALSEALGAPVSVKGKRTEGLPGLAGGAQCHAVALCWRRREHRK